MKTDEKIVELLKVEPKLSLKEIADKLETKQSTISMAIKKLVTENRIFINKIRIEKSFVTYASLNPINDSSIVSKPKSEPQPNLPKIEGPKIPKKIKKNEPGPIKSNQDSKKSADPKIHELEQTIQKLQEELSSTKKGLTLEDILKPKLSERKLMGIFDLIFNRTPKGKNKKAILRELIEELQKIKGSNNQ